MNSDNIHRICKTKNKYYSKIRSNIFLHNRIKEVKFSMPLICDDGRDVRRAALFFIPSYPWMKKSPFVSWVVPARMI